MRRAAAVTTDLIQRGALGVNADRCARQIRPAGLSLSAANRSFSLEALRSQPLLIHLAKLAG
jgi:hypothetical protein